jgi:hypothetical protein
MPGQLLGLGMELELLDGVFNWAFRDSISLSKASILLLDILSLSPVRAYKQVSRLRWVLWALDKLAHLPQSATAAKRGDAGQIRMFLGVAISWRFTGSMAAAHRISPYDTAH